MIKNKIVSFFEGRNLVIATMHHKERVIAPLLENNFNVNCFTPNNFDTDLLGTFSGEIERLGGPIKTLRDKCNLAMEITNCDLGVASEGSFGSHPLIPFVNCNEELLIFIDKKNNLEIIQKEISVNTNFNGKEIKTELELSEFAKSVKFPSHALIIKSGENDNSKIVKGITNWEILYQSFNEIIKTQCNAYVLTDMRAMYNPTRMSVIKKNTENLIDKIKTCCPNCQTPGFEITDYKPGILCQQCRLPTKSIKTYIYTCKKCNYILEKEKPNVKAFEDPTFCDFCNP